MPLNFFDQPDNKLHYDLSFLNVGEMWQGNAEKFRLSKYTMARLEFELDPKEALLQMFPNGLLYLGTDLDKFEDSVRLLGYPRLLTLKTVDMVMGKAPSISISANHELTEKVRDMRANADFDANLFKALIDYSRFGVTVLRVYKCEKTGKALLTPWDPSEWIPVFYPDGTKRIHYNVLGWREPGQILRIQIHNTEDGSYEERVYNTDDTNALLELKSSTTYNQGFKRPLVYAILNTPTSTNPVGQGDYMVINGVLQKALERLSGILRVLDEHADPCMTGPTSLLSKTENGEMVFKTSKYYAVSADEEKPSYITWDANLESSFKAFDLLCKQMFILSEMGEAFLGVPEGSGNVVSGSAMRFKMVTALDKARRIQNAFTRPLQCIISTMLAINGDETKLCDVHIEWKDSLPKDPKETAELAKAESGTTSVKPLLHAIMDNFDLDKETAEKWIKEIMSDREKFGPHGNGVPNPNPDGSDGRSKIPGSSIDTRKKDDPMNPAKDENHPEDRND